MNSLTLGNTAIRQHDGLYSLNDLHAASGGEAKHRPNYFTDNDQTRALVAEIDKAGNPALRTTRGRYAATYACRELVIAYAAWISAAFHLKVIRVFLDSVAALPVLPPDCMMVRPDSISLRLSYQHASGYMDSSVTIGPNINCLPQPGDCVVLQVRDGYLPIAIAVVPNKRKAY